VEVRQNGYLIQSQTVSPGAFAITDLPVTGSGSDLQITVIESDGTIQRFSVPFTTPVIALREGYMKYNVTVGQYRPPDNAVENSLLGQLTTMYGLPWGITAFTGVQASQHYKSGAMGIGWSLGNLGAVSFDAIHARSQQKGRGRDSGDTWSIRYSKSFELTNTDLTAARYQYTSSGFHTLSDVLSTFRNDNFRAYSYSGDRSRRTTLRLNQSLGSLGYMSFYGSRDEFRHNRQKQDSFGMSYGTSWKNISWYVNCSRNYSTNAYYQRGHIEDSINLWMNIPLGQWIGGRDNDINVTTQTQRTTGQNTWYETGLNGRAFDRRLYWDVSERIAPGSENNVDSSRLNLRWFGTYGELAGMYSYSSYIRQMSAGISGGMVLHNEGITLGQKGEDTVALVVAPGVNGASVGSLPGVRTDTRGYTLVNHVSPYQENLITLDPTTFPENVEVSQTDTRVVPTKGAVVRAKFITRVGGRALITLSRSDGSRLPFGAVVTEEGKKGQMPGGAGVVGDNGEVYLSGLDETGQLKVQWGRNSSCRANYRLPEEKEATGIFLVRTVCM
ncbi:fimbria/pilus outer membrane usher protein, partial [Escherichia coli]|nr:fimbria/pilus outer membrane usher protein [Escherichia coli]EEQ4911572.1 fimbria/pilus outer membrane usher protein [Escherichia coli]EET2436469.1 fimbria/pilus outer membrane usher protein [Escherichia coli]EET3776544.1 fimbria/pilus outer membrane usher protein [Escherichia coli]EEZ2280644.1 fimbria/pilus outer membrane usher protein [Escherichia coli]